MCKTCPGFYIFGKFSLDSKKIKTLQTNVNSSVIMKVGIILRAQVFVHRNKLS